MSDDVEATTELVEHLLSGVDSVLVQVDDVDTVAHALTSATGAQVFDPGRTLDQAIATCIELRGGELLFDVDELRAVAQRRAKAQLLAQRTLTAARERLQAVSAMVMHPESIRKAADDVFAARSDLDGAQAALDEAESAAAEADVAPVAAVEETDSDEPDQPPAVDATGSVGDDPPTDRALLAALAACVVALALGAGVLVATGSPLGLLLVVPTVIWAVLARRRTDEEDAAQDSRRGTVSLANAEALSDLAFHRSGGVESLAPPETVVAAAEVRDDAAARLRLAENRWTSLVGSDVAVDDVDSYLRLHDPQFEGVSAEAATKATPVLVAQRRAQRLEAQWRAMWWSLDREPPSVDHADDAITQLAAEGLAQITTEVVADRLLGRPGPEAMVVVVDRNAEIAADDFATRTAGLPTGARVIALVPPAENGKSDSEG